MRNDISQSTLIDLESMAERLHELAGFFEKEEFTALSAISTQLRQFINAEPIETKKKIVICLEGGLISQVLTETPTDVFVVDYDTNYLEPDQVLCELFKGSKGIVSTYPSEENPAAVKDVSEKILEAIK